MGFQGFEAAAVAKIPNAQSFIISSTQQVLAAAVEHEPSHPIIMARQCHHAQTRRHVPQLEETDQHSLVSSVIIERIRLRGSWNYLNGFVSRTRGQKGSDETRFLVIGGCR